MPKLFVAIDLPTKATEALAAIQPAASAGIRLVSQDQMHVTLHYLGEADRDRTADALRTVALPAFTLTVEGVGQFTSVDGTVLWAGVRESPELLRLHAAVATALGGQEFRPEARRYTPHVTLARCVPATRTDVVADFLARHAAFVLSGVAVTGFGLFSSTFSGEAPRYWAEAVFPLPAAEVS
jgi:RNA 2',3'-cyclic 3'-phosphodiesterase